jgi:hypothetical protein
MNVNAVISQAQTETLQFIAHWLSDRGYNQVRGSDRRTRVYDGYSKYGQVHYDLQPGEFLLNPFTVVVHVYNPIDHPLLCFYGVFRGKLAGTTRLGFIGVDGLVMVVNSSPVELADPDYFDSLIETYGF